MIDLNAELGKRNYIEIIESVIYGLIPGSESHRIIKHNLWNLLLNFKLSGPENAIVLSELKTLLPHESITERMLWIEMQESHLIGFIVGLSV